MSTELDLDDVAATSPLATRELAELRATISARDTTIEAMIAGHAVVADALQAHAQQVVALSDEARLKVRDACRRRFPLDGTDAQCLEHALTITERERDAALKECERLREQVGLVALAEYMKGEEVTRLVEQNMRLRVALEGLLTGISVHNERIAGRTGIPVPRIEGAVVDQARAALSGGKA